MLLHDLKRLLFLTFCLKHSIFFLPFQDDAYSDQKAPSALFLKLLEAYIIRLFISSSVFSDPHEEIT